LPLFIIKEEISYVQLSPPKIEFIHRGLQLKRYHSMKRILKTCNRITQLDDNMELWHRRLGHFNIATIKEILKNIKIDEKCKVGIRSNFKKNKPYKPYKRSINRANEPFELIPMETTSIPNPSIYGNKSFFFLFFFFFFLFFFFFCCFFFFYI